MKQHIDDVLEGIRNEIADFFLLILKTIIEAKKKKKKKKHIVKHDLQELLDFVIDDLWKYGRAVEMVYGSKYGKGLFTPIARKIKEIGGRVEAEYYAEEKAKAKAEEGPRYLR